MPGILVPVDGSANSDRAVQYVIDFVKKHGPLTIHLLTVQPPIMSGDVMMFVTKDMIDSYHREEGEKALQAARRMLDASGISYTSVIIVGHIAETISHYAKEHECEGIVMGTRGMGAVSSLILGSIATKVIHLTDRPVTLIK